MVDRDYRIYKHPIIDFRRGRRVRFYYGDTVVEAFEGESILAALYAVGYRVFSYSSKLGRPRGAFCMIGKCSSCFSYINGVPYKRICIEPVRDGLRVEIQRGIPEPPVNTPLEDIETIEKEVDLLVIGGGPAGLHAALAAVDYGLKVAIVDEGLRLGGQLVKQTHKFFGSREYYCGMRGFEIADMLEKRVREKGVDVHIETSVYGYFRGGVVGAVKRGGRPLNILFKPRAIVAATGAMERGLAFENNDLPGVMGAGGAQTLMNQYGVRPGDKALVIGSGNVGLIVSYQLLQAGVKVEAIVEIMPRIGGWFVHAAKVKRLGIPIMLRHTIACVEGVDRVEKAVVHAVDENWKPIPGSEKAFDVDLVLLAIGLQPDYRFFSQAGCAMKWIPELGGLVPLRTRYLETSVENLYIAGDAAGIEEATTAFIEGEIAGLSAAIKLGYAGEEAISRREKLLDFLWNVYRRSPVVERARIGKEKATVSEEEMIEIRKRQGI